MNSDLCNAAFERSIADYHVSDDVDTPIQNPFPTDSFEAVLYSKNWIDTVQWHLEDIIRRPDLDSSQIVAIKRRIDKSNQDRTDLVEQIDDRIITLFQGVEAPADAPLNTETPAWAIDRLSILALKIYHMKEQTDRTDVDEAHRATCQQKLSILLEQRVDLSQSLDDLLEDIRTGKKRVKVYRQMKMYNDAKLNPELYGKQADS